VHARVTLVEIDTLRIGLDDALALWREQVQARLAAQDGYAGVLVMANPDGRGMLISFWETEDAAEHTADLYAEALERFMTFFRQPAGRDRYEVLVADIHTQVPAAES
jgi:hypothetical protein